MQIPASILTWISTFVLLQAQVARSTQDWIFDIITAAIGFLLVYVLYNIDKRRAEDLKNIATQRKEDTENFKEVINELKEVISENSETMQTLIKEIRTEIEDTKTRLGIAEGDIRVVKTAHARNHNEQL
jgi:polyribonucleotide nucleotidyltransferase